jgi:hypothetical protein
MIKMRVKDPTDYYDKVKTIVNWPGILRAYGIMGIDTKFEEPKCYVNR